MSKILFLTHHPGEAAGTRYRINQFLPLLEAAGHQCTVWPFSTAALFRSLNARGQFAVKAWHTLYCTSRRLYELSRLSDFDTIVIHREVFPFLIPMMEKWVLSHHPRVIFDFDDAVYAGHPDPSALNHPLLYRLKYGSGINEVLLNSSHVIAGNRLLAEYARLYNSNVTTVPTVVDCNLYPYLRMPAPDGKITIGWMGSRSTAPYLKAINSVLHRIAVENKERVRFRFFGFPEYKLDLPDFISRPFSLATEIADLCSIDIGLMPLPDTEWTRGKCAFKAIQYMAVGAVPIASPVGITEDLIKSGVNGLLATSKEDWFHAIQLLITDSSLRQTLSINARKAIEEQYSLRVWGPEFVSVLEEVGNEQGTTTPISESGNVVTGGR